MSCRRVEHVCEKYLQNRTWIPGDYKEWTQTMYSKTCVKWPLSKGPKIGFQDQVSLKGNFGYCPRASFVGGKRGKLSGSRLSTIFKFTSIQVSDTFTSGGCAAFSRQKRN